MEPISRRAFVAGAAAALGLAVRPAGAQARRSRLIMLATGGGPRPRKDRGSTAHALVVDNVLYVIDCGNGVARQIVQAGVPVTALRHVFITHHHSDHNADYGNLLLLTWASGFRGRIDAWGPPPLTTMTRLFLELNAYDIDTRVVDEGRPPLAPMIHPHEISQPGLVMQDERVKVTATLVHHPPVTPALGFRFDCPDRSIVFSGDTNKSENLIALARGADVLVHEAMFMPGVERLVARVRNAVTLRQHLIDSHTTVEDVGRVATAAGVKTLVLSHLVPADDPEITDAMWLAAARPYFGGTIVIARDGMEL